MGMIYLIYIVVDHILVGFVDRRVAFMIPNSSIACRQSSFIIPLACLSNGGENRSRTRPSMLKGDCYEKITDVIIHVYICINITVTYFF